MAARELLTEPAASRKDAHVEMTRRDVLRMGALGTMGLKRAFRHKTASEHLGGREVYALPLTPGFYGVLLLGMRGPTSDYLLSLYMSIAVWVDPVEDAVARITGAECPLAGPARCDSPVEEALARIAHDAGHSDAIRASAPYTNIRGKNNPFYPSPHLFKSWCCHAYS